MAQKTVKTKEAKGGKFSFFAADQYGAMPKSAPAPVVTPAPKAPATSAPTPSLDEKVREILNKNPLMNASTFLNTLKAYGIELVDKTSGVGADVAPASTPEATSASAAAPVLRADDKKKESRIHDGFIRCRFLEASAKVDGIGPTRFRTILIQEGLGNFQNAFYYTKEALQDAVPLFEGKKCYADHPAADEEETRPERSVRDIIGHFENVSVQESKDGRAQLIGDLVLMPDKPYEWARALVREALAYSKKYPDKDLIGLSINANGDAEEIELEAFMKETTIPESAKPKLVEALQKGITTIRPVRKFSSAVSADLVTEAGAGGQINSILEGDRQMGKKEEEAKKHEAEKLAKEAADLKAKEESEKGEKPAKPEGGEDTGHDDAEKDKELIKSMLAKYVGGEDHSEEECNAAHEAFKAAKNDMGMDHEEAMKCAGYAMKMSKHMAAKKHEAEQEESAKKEEADKLAKEESEKGEKKEAARVIELSAENAKLKESLRGIEVEKHLDKTLRESGLPMSATKKFRECVGVPKTTKEIDEKFKLFKEAYGIGGEAEGFGFVVSMEKNENRSDSGTTFADCVKGE